jgi:hypothetical protein
MLLSVVLLHMFDPVEATVGTGFGYWPVVPLSTAPEGTAIQQSVNITWYQYSWRF